MNEQLFYVLSRQRYYEDVKRGEANYTRQTAIGSPSTSPRARFASVLVSLATKLQPEIVAGTPQPINPAAV